MRRYLLGFTIACTATFAQAPHAISGPDIRVYKTVGSTKLTAHIFQPTDSGGIKSAVVLFHGGGWTDGSPEWVYPDAEHFAAKGMLAVAAEYRLSDQKAVTPLEAIEDARDLIRWVRRNAADLRVNPERIAAYGVSAGGHLAAAAAVFNETSEGIGTMPNALLLLSPAVSLQHDPWAQRLLGKRADVGEISPAEHVGRGMPPVIIFVGDADTVTPLAGVRRFCERISEQGGNCELHIYKGVGHLLTRSLDRSAQEQGPFDPDPRDIADRRIKSDEFLTKLGYFPNPANSQ